MKSIVLVLLMSAAAQGADKPADDAAMGRRVQDLLRAHQADVFGCVQSTGTKAAGEMLVRVMVGPDQKAAKSDVLKDQSGGGPLGACLTGKIKTWDLTPLLAAAGDQVVFPLAFKPGKPEKHVLVAKAEQQSQGHQRWLIDEESVGEPPLAAMTLFSLTPQQQLPAGSPRPEEVVLYVLEGQLAHPDGPLGPGDALWVAAGATRPLIGAADKKPLKLLECAAHGGGQGQKVIRSAELNALPIAGGKGTAKLYTDGVSSKLAVDQLELEADAAVAPHKHAGTDELLYIVSGSGTTTVAGKPYPVAAGDALRIGANLEHSFTVTEAMRAIQIYAPAGPEQRFKPEPPKRKKGAGKSGR